MSRSIVARRSPIHGTGVFAAKDLPAGKYVIRYRGRLLKHADADREYGDDGESGHTFLFTLNSKYVIDGNVGGNVAKWINHSCEPNCQAVWEEDGENPAEDNIWIETLRPIDAGEELTYDYGIQLECRQTARLKKLWACLCGSPSCTGTLLKPKRAARKPK